MGRRGESGRIHAKSLNGAVDGSNVVSISPPPPGTFLGFVVSLQCLVFVDQIG